MEKPEVLSLDLVTTIQAGFVKTNLETIKVQTESQMAYYKEIKVTLETLTESKKDLAQIRKFKAAMKDNKEGSLKQYNMPMEKFIVLFDEVFDILTDAETALDKQVKEIQKKELDNLLAVRIDLFSEAIKLEDKELRSYLSRCKGWLIPKEWRKKTVSNKSINDYIATTIISVKTAYAAFKDHMYAEELLKAYATTGDFNATFTIMQVKDQEYQKILAMQQAAKEEARAKADAEKQRADAEAQRQAILAERMAEAPKFRMPTNEEIQSKQQLACDHLEQKRIQEQKRLEKDQKLQVEQELPQSAVNPFAKPDMEEDLAGVVIITPPPITVPNKGKALDLCKINTYFEGDRWKIQALLDFAKLIHLKRVSKKELAAREEKERLEREQTQQGELK